MRRIGLLTACLAAVVIAGCASAPPVLVTLPPVPAPAQRAEPSASATVLLREVSLPGYLDNFPVVVSRKGSVLAVARDAEWAERPSLAVSRALRDALSQRLGPSQVLIAGDGRIPDADLTIEFLALDPEESALQLDARWFFACTRTAGSHAGRTRLQVPLTAATPQAVAAASSEALARFADVLANEPGCADERSALNRDRTRTLR